jgi:hypothetical protein
MCGYCSLGTWILSSFWLNVITRVLLSRIGDYRRSSSSSFIVEIIVYV